MKKVLFAGIAFVAIVCIWYVKAVGPVDASSDARKKVEISSGSSTTNILTTLKSEGVIRSELAAKLYLKIQGLDGKLQAGVFLLEPSMSLGEIVDILQTGRAQELIVTIPEGFTVKDIDQKLAELDLIEEGDAIDCANTCDFSSYDFLPFDAEDLAERGGLLEGYLFPDTYYVPANEFVVKFFFERMLNGFRNTVLNEYADQIESSGRSLHDIVTMASLVEEETRTDEERPIVAGILWKRFDAGWGLGIDAAVRFIVNKPTDAITHGDLNVNSPYNLRKFTGMPPGPIANVGIKSIEATLNPSESSYWYYLHDKTGQIHYSETNEEHNVKRYMYLGGGSN